MTEEQEKAKRRKDVLKRMRMTRRGETICLAWWEVDMVLDYINELKGGTDSGNAQVQA